MKFKEVELKSGKTVTRRIPETVEEMNQLLEEAGAEAGIHSMADGPDEPIDLDTYEGDPELGGSKFEEDGFGEGSDETDT